MTHERTYVINNRAVITERHIDHWRAFCADARGVYVTGKDEDEAKARLEALLKEDEYANA